MASDDSSPAASLEKQKRGIRRKKSASQLELLEKIYAGTKYHKYCTFLLSLDSTESVFHTSLQCQEQGSTMFILLVTLSLFCFRV